MSGFSLEEVRDALARARRRVEDERRAEFARFGIAGDCLWPASRLFHRHSMLGPAWQPSMTVEEVERLTYDCGYKSHVGAPLVTLPEAVPVAGPLDATIRARRSRSEFAPRPLALQALATLLALGGGITETGTLPRRASPSGGALYPVELYPIALDVEGLAPRVYHYRPDAHALEALAPVAAGVFDPFLPPGVAASRPPLLIALTASFARTQAKYLERGYRFALLECGHIAQNMLLAATALGLAALPIGGFWDEPLNDLLGVEPEEEAAVYAVAVGNPAGDGG